MKFLLLCFSKLLLSVQYYHVTCSGRGRKPGGGMQLGKKKKNIDNFVGQIEAEGGGEDCVCL